MKRLMVLAIIVCFSATLALASDNWPMWRGPDGTGVAKDSDPPHKVERNRKYKMEGQGPRREPLDTRNLGQ